MFINEHQNAVQNVKECDVEAHYPECVAGHVVNESALMNGLADKINQCKPEKDSHDGRDQRRDDVRAGKAREFTDIVECDIICVGQIHGTDHVEQEKPCHDPDLYAARKLCVQTFQVVSVDYSHLKKRQEKQHF